MRFHLSAVVALVLAFGASSARASVIYQQLPGAGSNSAVTSSSLNGTGGTPGFTTADDWSLGTSALIADVHWWGKGSGGENFQFTFYGDGVGAPGAVLLTTGGTLSRVADSPGTAFDPVFFYSSDLTTPFAAAAGTTYWLSVFNQASDASWLWLAADANGNGARQRQNPAGAWGPSFGGTDLAFQLTTTGVPEPTSLLLLGMGLAAYRLRRHQNDRKH